MWGIFLLVEKPLLKNGESKYKSLTTINTKTATIHKKIKYGPDFYFIFSKTLIWKIKIVADVSLLIQ